MFDKIVDSTRKFFSSGISKKGQLGGVIGVVGSLATLAILFGISILATALIVGVVDDYRTTQVTGTCIIADGNANCSSAYNSSTSGLGGMNNFTSNFTTIGTILGAVVMILIVIGGLGFAVGRRFT